jgi:hypothetical protein
MLFGVQSLIVSHFRPRDGEVLTICDFMIPLKPIQSLFDLTVVDLQIDMSESPLARYEDMEDVNLTDLETLDVCDLECFDPVNTILTAVGTRLKSTSITRCVTSDVHDFRGCLNLEGINCNISQLLRCWNGKKLFVSHCPGFDDSVLEDIGLIHDRNGVFSIRRAANLHTLSISDCSNVSAAGLKRLVRGRRCLSDSEGQLALKKLFVSGDVPHITPKDRLWFTKKLLCFGYRGPELDSDSGSAVDSNGSGTDSDDTDDTVYDSDASVSDTSSGITNYSV